MNFSFFRRLFSDIWFVARREKKWWLMPLIVLLVVIGSLLVIGSLAGPLAPFIYPLF